MSVTIEINEHVRATVDGFVWSCDDQFYSKWLNGLLEIEHPEGPTPSMGDPDYYAADMAIKELGRGKIVEGHDIPEGPEDRVY